MFPLDILVEFIIAEPMRSGMHTSSRRKPVKSRKMLSAKRSGEMKNLIYC